MTREDEIFKKLKQGDGNAPEELVKLYYPEILRYCLWHAPDRMAAEDAVQETFLKAIRFLDRYEHKGKFRPFLYQIAANTCVAEKEGGAFTGGSGIYRTGIFPGGSGGGFQTVGGKASGGMEGNCTAAFCPGTDSAGNRSGASASPADGAVQTSQGIKSDKKRDSGRRRKEWDITGRKGLARN